MVGTKRASPQNTHKLIFMRAGYLPTQRTFTSLVTTDIVEELQHHEEVDGDKIHSSHFLQEDGVGGGGGGGGGWKMIHGYRYQVVCVCVIFCTCVTS